MPDTNCTHPTGALTITPDNVTCGSCGQPVDLDNEPQLTEDEEIARMWAWRAAGEAALCARCGKTPHNWDSELCTPCTDAAITQELSCDWLPEEA